MKNTLTSNAALVEIKRPSTTLLAKTEYRGGVFAPSGELVSAISQILDQKIKLTTSIAQTRYNSKKEDFDVSAVDCVVLVGMTPTDKDKIRSFELYRNALKDVRVLTFNELLEKLQILRELLAGERYVSDIPDDEAMPAGGDNVTNVIVEPPF